MLEVSLLGTGGMLPLPNRYLTSFLCRYNGDMLLIDCGEGTQITLQLLGWGFKNIGVICVTHFHADHISGLPGLLLAIANAGRTETLNIIGPPGIKEIVRALCIIAPDLPFDIEFIVFTPKANMQTEIYGMIVSGTPLDHRCAGLGYSITINRIGKFDVERAKLLDIPIRMWKLLQRGESFDYENGHYTPDMVLGEERKGIKVSYITDSRPKSQFIDFVRGSDLFVCEGLYGDFEKIDKVKAHKHMVFPEAAEIAKNAEVSELWLTHFSPAFLNPNASLINAANIFKNTVVPKDRRTKTIIFQD